MLKPLASGSLGGAMEFAILVQHSGPYTGLPCYLVGCSEFSGRARRNPDVVLQLLLFPFRGLSLGFQLVLRGSLS